MRAVSEWCGEGRGREPFSGNVVYTGMEIGIDSFAAMFSGNKSKQINDDDAMADRKSVV